VDRKNYVTNTDRKYLDVTQLRALSESVGSRPRLEEKWVRALTFSPFIAFVTDEAKTLVGFGRIESDGIHYLIYDMCVNPQMQGKGIGTAIIKSLLSQAEKSQISAIGLSAWTKKARSFYLKCGFVDSKTELDLTNYMQIEI